MLGEAHPLCGAASGHPTFPAFARDLAAGAGDVAMSEALARKYPSAAAEWGLAVGLPARRWHVEIGSGIMHRHHLDPSVVLNRGGAWMLSVIIPDRISFNSTSMSGRKRSSPRTVVM